MTSLKKAMLEAPGKRSSITLSAIGMTLLLAGCSSMGMGMGMGNSTAGKVSLNGASEVPPNVSTATGSGVITVAADHSVSGSVSTTGITGKVAHIHLAAKGSNGPVVIPLTKGADGTWTVPAGAKLTDAQYASYVAGNLYVNVHSEAMPAGEIRGQISSN